MCTRKTELLNALYGLGPFQSQCPCVEVQEMDCLYLCILIEGLFMIPFPNKVEALTIR